MGGIIGTWRMALEGIEKGLELLEEGHSAGQLAEEVIKEVENNPDYISVGYGGLPNREGKVQLDAGFMNGDNLSLGAVAGLEGIKNPISLARSLSKNKINNILLGDGAKKYALAQGFKEEELLTREARQSYLERLKDKDQDLKAYDGHDTVGVVALDKKGSLVAATSTSGLFMKDDGRMGDSPIVGSGFYADSLIGGAVATGLGEDVMKGVISYEIVRLMEELSPQEACEKAVFNLDRKLRERRSAAGDISVVAMNKEGQWGAATNSRHFSFVVGNNQELSVYLMKYEDSKLSISRADQDWINNHRE